MLARFLLLLAASATALNLGAPVVRSTRPSLRRVRTGRFAHAPCCLIHTATEPLPLAPWQPLAVMQVEEEAMTEEEYEAELAAQEAQIVSNVKEVEEDILSPQEVEAMKAKIANYAPWMSVDPEARQHKHPRPLTARLCECCAPTAPLPRCAGHRAREEGA